ncbi:DUF4177 domain-containing protein [Curtobacterium flaccumfaciens pv. oortii]|uniref:DUF4177 domain-containing protein n=1 Tax=Curtobacterium flaccumfaciens TaxID=2035 RepID=UPI00265856BC|nr:DUF4177 domain-containing protein [Curtobacterium flaccumfaciens]MCS5524811.1 DUF4177 domain-containing protein [Curtobacterium flaccumfaciens pv. oortii]
MGITKMDYQSISCQVTKEDNRRAGDTLAQRAAEVQSWGASGWRLVSTVSIDQAEAVIISDTFERESLSQ